MDLERARRDAKALLRAARAGDPDALARMRAQDAPSREEPLLADAQLTVARELGVASWPALVVRAAWPLSALMQNASAAGDLGAVRRLLDAGAAVGPSRALTHAIVSDDAAMVAALLARRDRSLSGRDWPEWRDALITAVRFCCGTAVVDALRAGGCPPDAVDGYGRPVAVLAWRLGRDDFPRPATLTDSDRFSRACWTGDETAARALAGAGGLEDAALCWAALAGRLDAVTLLADVGGLPLDLRGIGGLPALLLAEHAGHTQVVAALLARGARRDVAAPEFSPVETRFELQTRLAGAWLANVGRRMPDAETWALGDGIAVRGGVGDNTYNGVFASRASDAEIADALERLAGVPASWTVPDGGALGGRLVAAGAREETLAMVVQAERDALRLERPAPGDVVVERADGSAWAELPDEGVQTRFELASDVLRLVVARRDGRVVGGGALLVERDAALIADLHVRGGHRHRGIASALLRGLVAGAPEVRELLVEPTPTSSPFWALVGFSPAAAQPRTTFYLPLR